MPDIQIGRVTDNGRIYAITLPEPDLQLLIQMIRGEKYDAARAATATTMAPVRLTEVVE